MKMFEALQNIASGVLCFLRFALLLHERKAQSVVIKYVQKGS